MFVRALKKYYYDKKEYQPGEELEIDDRMESDVNILCTIGTLEKVSRGYDTRAMQAAPIQKPPPEKKKEPTKANEQRRYYRRRDLEAEK